MDNDQYLNEVREALENDDTRLGDVWRLSNEGKSATEIAKELNVPTLGFVFNNKIYIRAIKKGNLSKSPTMARRCGSALRGFLKRHREDFSFSEETIQELEKRAEECDRIATDLQAVEDEEAKVKKETRQQAEKSSQGSMCTRILTIITIRSFGKRMTRLMIGHT